MRNLLKKWLQKLQLKELTKIKAGNDKWYDENWKLGIQLGYPECCVHQFCIESPFVLATKSKKDIDQNRYDSACQIINGKGGFHGFVPCSYHALEILSGRINLEDLIKDRNPIFPPFPEF